MAGAAIGVAFVVRAVGDVQRSVLTWLSRGSLAAAGALVAGQELDQRLARVRELEESLAAPDAERETIEAQLAAARAGLIRIRADINRNLECPGRSVAVE